MAYNTLSGSVSIIAADTGIQASGSFTGSFEGDGANLENVKQFDLFGDTDAGKIPFFKEVSGKKHLEGDSTFFFNSATDTLNVSNLSASSGINLSGITAGTATTASYLALDSNNNVVLTSSSGGGGSSGGTIGAAEDGDYTDGLFTDFTTATAIGIPIDRYNEVLKILAPTPAPALSRINYQISNGVTAKLSFGSSQPVTDYTSSATAAGFAAVDITGSYSATASGDNFRLGIFDGTQDVTGTLNFHVDLSTQNGYVSFSSGAFGNAETGSLKLELNGTVIHTVALAGLVGAGNPATGSANSLTSDSGFTNVSITASSFIVSSF